MVGSHQSDYGLAPHLGARREGTLADTGSPGGHTMPRWRESPCSRRGATRQRHSEGRRKTAAEQGGSRPVWGRGWKIRAMIRRGCRRHSARPLGVSGWTRVSTGHVLLTLTQYPSGSTWWEQGIEGGTITKLRNPVLSHRQQNGSKQADAQASWNNDGGPGAAASLFPVPRAAGKRSTSNTHQRCSIRLLQRHQYMRGRGRGHHRVDGRAPRLGLHVGPPGLLHHLHQGFACKGGRHEAHRLEHQARIGCQLRIAGAALPGDHDRDAAEPHHVVARRGKHHDLIRSINA